MQKKMTTSEIIAALGDMPAFHRLERKQLEELARLAVVRTFAANAVFFSEERSAKGLHVLLYGKVKLFRVAEDGKEQTIFIFRPGEPFCLCSVFSDGTLPASMAALEESLVLYISPDDFSRLSKEDPTIVINLMRIMARRLKEAMDMIDALSLKQLPSRLAAYFVTSAREGRTHLDVTHRELSKIVGATPEAVSRALKRMAEHDVLRIEGREVDILSPDMLQHIADGGEL